MQFMRRAPHGARSIALYPGAWNPPTLAHLALAAAARHAVEEVVFVLPRTLPHKEYAGPGFDERLALLLEATAPSAFPVAVSEGGLFVEIVREFRRIDAAPEVKVLCGRDAAERIVGWQYPAGEPIARQLEEFELLVAPRGGAYCPPAPLGSRIHVLPVEGCDEVSSSRVRKGELELVPDNIREAVGRLYR